jgi:sugar/nucleoside kinase (ribokinase family)
LGQLAIELDYLVIGHVTHDLVDGAYSVGGTVSYAARTARAWGCSVGIITSAGPNSDWRRAIGDVRVTCSTASDITTFENIYTSDGRCQILQGVAEPLTLESAPASWKTSLVHIGPVAQECDPALVNAFGDAFVGVTPQGWMRSWDRDGIVERCQWECADEILTRADAVVLSDEDVGGEGELIARYAARTRLLVVTHGARGCTVHLEGESCHFPAPVTPEVDSTGAGDIFAATFFIFLQRGENQDTAARAANCVASHSVTRVGLSSTPLPQEISRCAQNPLAPLRGPSANKNGEDYANYLRTG